MRKLLPPLFLLFSLTGMSAGLYSAVIIPTVSSTNQITKNHFPQLNTLKVKGIEKKIGRKLTIKERISLFILKKAQNAEKNNSGTPALIFGIIGAALFLFLFAVPSVLIWGVSFAAAIVAIVAGSVAKKQDPDDRKARAAILLGLITLAATPLALIIAFIALAS